MRRTAKINKDPMQKVRDMIFNELQELPEKQWALLYTLSELEKKTGSPRMYSVDELTLRVNQFYFSDTHEMQVEHIGKVIEELFEVRINIHRGGFRLGLSLLQGVFLPHQQCAHLALNPLVRETILL